MEDKILDCIVFDQDCFHDVRRYAADKRQRQWINEYLPELEEISKSEVLYRRRTETIPPEDRIIKFGEFDRQILKKLWISNIVILGSTQDGLYLEKGFSIIGSKEWSDVTYTDLDVLFQYDGIDIKQSATGSELATKTKNESVPDTFLLLTKTKYHGYFKLRIVSPESKIYTGPIYLKAKTLKWQLLNHLDTAEFYVSTNLHEVIGESPALGGAIEDELGTHVMDYVVALKMKEWPKLAESFISREKASGWPAESLVHEIIQEGCGFVSTGHNFCKDDEFQWRISFASSEQILIRSLNRAQIRSFLFFKTVFKIHFSDFEFFSSYMLKHVFFWTIEMLPLDIWQERNIVYRVESLTDMLCSFLDKKIISNFFLSTLNLIGHVDESDFHELAEKAHDIQNDFLGMFIKFAEETSHQTSCADEPSFQAHCEVSLSLLNLKAMTLTEVETDAILSMVHFSTYIFLRAQRRRYQLKLLPETINECFDNNCQSIYDVIPPRAAWYLVEALKVQPDTTAFKFQSKNNSFDMDLSVFRKAVIYFWKSDIYTGIFTKVLADHESVTGETVDTLPEFDTFLEWVDLTCKFAGYQGMIPTSQKYPWINFMAMYYKILPFNVQVNTICRAVA